MRLSLADPNDEADILAAVDLGNGARATLGLLPRAAYREAAASGTLVLARLGDSVIGYALYGLTAGRVRLTHLCVHPNHRGEGAARALVDWISTTHADLAGILVRCRPDYGLGPVWIKLGFTQVWEGPGRSRQGHPIVNWWRDHGHPNVFSRALGSVLVRASIDLNVLRDLVEESRPDAAEALALVGDDISDRLELVRTAALDDEMNSVDGPLRGRLIRRAQGLTSVRAPAADVATVHAAVLAAARTAWPGFPKEPQDHMDLGHVAESVAAGLNVFITRDERLSEVLGKPVEELYGLRVLRPVDVIVHIDELVRAEAYRPVAFLDTPLRRQLIGPGRSKPLLALLNTRAHEKPAALQRRIRDLAAAHHDRVGVFGPDGVVVAAYATIKGAGVLDVPLLRVADGAGADTLARQLLFLLRQQARDASLPVLRITDPNPSPAIVLAANSDGFLRQDAHYCAYVLDVAADAGEIEHSAVLAARSVGLPAPAPMRSGLPAVVAAEIERRWWPAKLIDSDLLTYLVPIRQLYSGDLLGVPPGLFPREALLGLSREHIYYRSPRGLRPDAPARILWYMSSSGGRGPNPPAVIACSQLEEVVTGSPDELHSRFRHLGVWNIDRITDAAHEGVVQALRFTNTEVFPRPIGLTRLRALGAARDEYLIPQGPLRISSALFAALYREGRSDA
jgi:GNAT superfamily N-acetyltransferase